MGGYSSWQLSSWFSRAAFFFFFSALKHFTLSPIKESDISFHSHYTSPTHQVSLLTNEKRLLMEIYVFGGESFTELGGIIKQLAFP